MWLNATNVYFCAMDLYKIYSEGDKFFLPNLSIDLVIIGYQEGDLKCLLLKIDNKWLLPGGYIKIDESVKNAAKRILKERTGLDNQHLKFLSVFGDKDRQFKEELVDYLKKKHLDWKEDSWVNNRFVTLTYYSLVDIDSIKPVIGNFDEQFSWFSFDNLPRMWMDHRSILLEARNRLKEDVQQEHLTYNLLADKFTMPELHQLHQTILGEKLDRSRFQKKMLSSGIFKRLPELQKESPGRNPYQYSVKSKEN